MSLFAILNYTILRHVACESDVFFFLKKNGETFGYYK